MKCINCKYSKKSRSKVYAGYCKKRGVHWKDEMNGCLEGVPKPQSRLRYAKLYRELMCELKKKADRAQFDATHGCGAGRANWKEDNAVAGSLYSIIRDAEEREAAEDERS